MRMPNGYGSVSKLPGARRRPWRVRKTIGWEITPEGKTRQKTQNIGFYTTKTEALAALAAYNADPKALSSITFNEIYERSSAERFPEISANSIIRYDKAFRRCERFHDRRFVEIRLPEYQAVIDSIQKQGAQFAVKTMLQMMYDYAVRCEIIGRDQDTIEYLKTAKAPAKTSIHYRFTADEIRLLWNASDEPLIQETLMLIYSGARPGELYALDAADVNLEERSFRIRRGKNANAIRVVPIHHKTLPFFAARVAVAKLTGMDKLFPSAYDKRGFVSNHSSFDKYRWAPVLRNVGVLEYVNDLGEVKEHLPDDTRHTFATMWAEQKLNEVFRRKIQGHSGRGVGENFYTHISFDELRDELDKLA